MPKNHLLPVLVAFASMLTFADPASGQDWVAVPTSAPNGNWQSLASSADGTTLAAAVGGLNGSGPIYISTNSGVTWTATSTPSKHWTSVAASADGTTLVAQPEA